MKSKINRFINVSNSIMSKKANFNRSIGATILGLVMLVPLAWMAPESYQLLKENDLIRSLKKKISSYNEQLPEDRVYLQFDKTFYEPGETVWFSAFVRNGQTIKPSLKSDIVHVELI